MTLGTHASGTEGTHVTLWNTEGEPGWGSSISSDLALTLAVDIHPTDLDLVKASNVGDNSSFTWISLRGGSFTALNGGEASEPIYGTQVVGHQGMSVSDLIQDSSRWVPKTNQP